MFVTLFGLTSYEGRDAPDASSKRHVVDVKYRRALTICSAAATSLRSGDILCLVIMPSSIGRIIMTGFDGLCGKTRFFALITI